MTTGGQYLSRRLEQLLPGVIAKPYELLKFYEGIIIPTVADLEAGAPEVLREKVSEVGDAVLTSDEAIDIPVVDISAEEVRYRTFMIASAFSFTMQQLRAIQKAGNANMVEPRKQLTAMRSIAERDNDLAAFGSGVRGITGFLNNGSVPAENSSTDLYDAATTADTVREFILDWAVAVGRATNGRFMSSDLVISYDLYQHLAKKRVPDGSMSVLNNLLQESGDLIRSITWAFEAGFSKLNAAGAGETDKDRITFYPFERMQADIDPEMEQFQVPEIIERHIEPTQVAPEEFWEVRGLRRVIPMFRCCTQTIINFPEAMQYVDHPKR